MFYYEVQFVTQNGQPYELTSSEISYEEREGDISEFPEAQQIEKPKYTLTITQLVGVNQDPIVSEESLMAGSIFTIDRMSVDGGFITFDAGQDLVLQTATGWSGVMPSQDTNVTIRYYQRTATIAKALWRAYANDSAWDSDLSLRTALSFERNEDYSSVDELPSDAQKIDDGTTTCSIYYWKDGDDAYWWSDADIAYLPEDCTALFYRCTTLKSIDLSDLDASKTTTMTRMFEYCNQVEDLDVKDLDTKNVRSMNDMFHGCSALTSLDVSGWNTESVANMESMFSWCSALTEIDLTNFDTHNVTNMHWMFDDCAGLVTVEFGNWDTSHVTNMARMFYNCTSLATANVEVLDTDSVTTFESMFYGCEAVEELDVSGWNTQSATIFQMMFGGCHSLIGLDLSEWNTASATDMSGMFTGCYALSSLDIEDLNVSGVTKMGYMFANCGSLVSLNLSKWNTESLTTLQQTFTGCTSLEELNVSGWKTSNVTTMSFMCADCSSLQSLDLSSWDTSKTSDMFCMFKGCTNLQSLDISSFDTTLCISGEASSLNQFFSDCNSLQTVVLGENFIFGGRYGALLPTPPTTDGYIGKWVRDDKVYGPYSAADLKSAYTSEMAGAWVWADSTIRLIINNVTLLSLEEYNTYQSNVPLNGDGWWWLRSPGYFSYGAEYVDYEGHMRDRSVLYQDGSILDDHVNNADGFVRPALMCDLSFTDLQIGDKLSIVGHTWTLISDSIILCDDFVGQTMFRSDPDAIDANIYAVSDVKVWLENWATNSGIMPEPEFTITEVTLLSEEEYTAYKSDIPVNSASWWWLRSPHATYANNAMCVASMNLLDYHGVQTYGSVRPALMCDLSGTDLLIGDQITLVGYSWTVIANDVILCDDFVGTSLFRADSDALNANVYDASDIKIWLSNWVEAHPFWTKTVTVRVIQ